jgi:hypothetical protein
MDKKSYEQLVAAVADGLTAIAELKVKQEAWETSLKGHNPGFHDHYQNQIGVLKSSKAFEANLELIASLKEKLLRE